MGFANQLTMVHTPSDVVNGTVPGLLLLAPCGFRSGGQSRVGRQRRTRRSPLESRPDESTALGNATDRTSTCLRLGTD